MTSKPKVDRSNMKPIKTDLHPFEATLPGIRLLFCWILPLLRYGYKNTIEQEDMFPVVTQDSVENLATKLEKNWQDEMRRCKTERKNPRLVRALIKTISFHLMCTAVPLFCLNCILTPSVAVLLAEFVNLFYQEDSTSHQMFLFATLLVINRMLLGLLIQPTYFWNMHLGMRSRIAFNGLIFKKILRLSQSSLRESSTGQIVNIVSTDIQILDTAVQLCHHLWAVPLQAVVTFIILWFHLGTTAILCLTMVIVIFPISAAISKVNSKLRFQKSLLTDSRIRVVNEIINAIQLIKVHAWEEPFTEKLQKARRSELSKIHQLCHIRSLVKGLPLTAGHFVLFVTIVTFAASGNLITPRVVFVVLPITLSLLHSVALHFFKSCVLWGEVMVVMKRTQKFLLLEELEIEVSTSSEVHPPEDGVTLQSKVDEDAAIPLLSEKKQSRYVAKEPCGISVKDLSAHWSDQCDENVFMIKGVTFSVLPGEVVAVVGPVGAGKSMLLMSLLGEIPVANGHINIEKKIGYASQQAWVFSGTLRENILFGKEYDERRFKEVLEKCDLNQDLLHFPASDLTLVGEKGIKLSGGQRSRVGLARVLYSDTNVYLLDDPLSAVDSRVGRHLFERCISGSSKAILLVTHQLQYLKSVDRILIMKEGQMSGYGTYQELQDAGIDFGSLLSENLSDEDHQTEEGMVSEDLKYGSQIDEVDMANPHSQDKLEVNVVPDNDFSNIPSRQSSKCEGNDEFTENEEKYEKKEVGSVRKNIYWEYITSGASFKVLTAFLAIATSAEACNILSNWWLAMWTKTEESCLIQYDVDTCLHNKTLMDNSSNFSFEVNRSFYYIIYAIFVTGLLVATFLSARLIFYILIKASTKLHNKMFEAVIRSPQQFFIVNPVGRILNRFAKDIGVMEDRLMSLFVDVTYFLLHFSAVYIFVTITNPFIIIILVPVVGLCWLLRRYYMNTSRDVKRLESLTNSPVYSHISLTLSGLSTIRAFKNDQYMYQQYCSHQDLNTSTHFLHLSLERWLSINMEVLQVLLCIVLVYGSVLVNNYFIIDGAKLGVSLAYLIGMAGEFAYCVRLTAELENLMVAAERVIDYTELKPEASLLTDVVPTKGWPHNGEIILENVSLRYSANGQYALKNINATLKSREKVGIVGRTGAGKSSMTAALLRLAEPSGRILIDGIDTSLIGLHDLRKNLSFIPQDPLLFEGTLRDNLDPFNQHSDEQLWTALEEVQLQRKVKQEPGKLEMQIAEGGSNFSVGEKQLVCLARALLCSNNILIIDEATANVDYETDQLIQTTIRQKFKNCTILTIAHRLSSVMESDRVLVLESGEIVEFDEPSRLLENANGYFTMFAEEARMAHNNAVQ